MSLLQRALSPIVEVRKEDGSLIALFRGNSYKTGAPVVDPAP